jgi:chemotaxis-related protein WspB
MLFLQFRLGQDSFALAADAIVEIVPLTAMQAAPRGEGGGVSFDYRGRFIPAVDLCLRELGRPAHARLSTRSWLCATGRRSGGFDRGTGHHHAAP